MTAYCTIDEHEIRAWIEEYGGQPAIVTKEQNKGGEEEYLHVAFGRGNPHSLVVITWEDFFERFERDNLAFMYELDGASDEHSLDDVYEFIDRDSVQVSLGSEEAALYGGDDDLPSAADTADIDERG